MESSFEDQKRQLRVEDKMDNRVKQALELAEYYGGIDGGHHKQWVIDQMVRALTGCLAPGEDYSLKDSAPSAEYLRWVAACEDGEDGPKTYEWEVGIAP